MSYSVRQRRSGAFVFFSRGSTRCFLRPAAQSRVRSISGGMDRTGLGRQRRGAAAGEHLNAAASTAPVSLIIAVSLVLEGLVRDVSSVV